MKILIDINHPAHVHYFKNFINIMKAKGHDFFLISRNKEIEHILLKKLFFSFYSRGKGSSTIIGKFFYFFKAVFIILKEALKFKPDILISFGTPYPAIVSKLINKPHFSIYDTEHAKLHHLLTDSFSKMILTPECYNKKLGAKQIFFNGYMELCYLHPLYFTPNPDVLRELNLRKNDKYVIIRFVSWNASHDIGHKGISYSMKKKAIYEFSKYAKIFITSESDLPDEFLKYKINISPEKIHDVIYYASLLYGESATMASESAVLGTPAIYLDNNGRGYTEEEEKKYGLIFNYSESLEDQQKSIEQGIKLLQIQDIKKEWGKKREKLLKEKIDVTDFLVTFFDNYKTSEKEKVVL